MFIALIIVTILSIVFGVYSLWSTWAIKREVVKREKQVGRRMYELAILKELGDRVGYSLNVQQIVDVITGSLHQFIEYSAVSYMLIEPEKVLFKMHLEKSVNRSYVDDVRNRMVGSLSALLDREFKREEIEEVLSGAILVDEVAEPIRSFFNIPLVIGDKVVGVLTVSNTEGGLYKEEEMTILYKITSQASQAVTKLQDVVRTEQSKLNAMVESMTDGVIMTDVDYRIKVINPSARKVIGVVEGKEVTIFDLIDNLSGKFDIRGRLEESVKLGKSYMSDKVLVGERFFQIFVLPVVSNSTLNEKKVLGAAVILHDITHEIELEHVREEFTSMIVHELRSPLDSIKKIGEALRDGTIKKSTKTYGEYIQMIYQNSSSMLELVNDILDVAKLEAGKFEVRLVPTDLKELIENRVDFYKLTAKDAHIAFKAVVDKALPTAMEIDPEGMKQILNNLISNALKFTPEKGTVTVFAVKHGKDKKIMEEVAALGVTLAVPLPQLAMDSSSDAIVVGVADTGTGIPDEHIGELFNKFKQIKSGTFTPSKKGTGLGLAIAKGIVEAHKGRIGVVSQASVGTVFYFVIPLMTTI